MVAAGRKVAWTNLRDLNAVRCISGWDLTSERSEEAMKEGLFGHITTSRAARGYLEYPGPYAPCGVAAALSMPRWTPQETAMRLRIQLLHRGEAVKEHLQRDGWKLKAESVDTLSACHTTVDSELAARRRLHGLGLLTSPTLRIEFSLLET
jgi:hypothetical protein